MITKVTLRNFKAFEQIELPIAPLTMISGVNGSGKSTILQGLAVLRQSYEAGCLTAKEGLLLNGEFVELGTGKDVLFEYAESQDIEIGVSSAAENYSWVFDYSEKNDVLALVGPTIDVLNSSIGLFSSAVQFLRADRISPNVVFPKSYTETVRRRFLGVRGQYAPHFLAHHQDQTISEGRRRAGSIGATLLDQVSAWLSEISPGVAIGSKEISGTDLAQLWYTFGGRAGLTSSNEYRPTNVGFGLTYALPIIIACLSAVPGDLVLIENPEAHLHPRGQGIMGALLAQAAQDGVQVIFETHSDHVLNGIRLAVKGGIIGHDRVMVHYCDAATDGHGSQIISPKISSDGRLSEWPAGFFDEWEKSLMELI